MALAAVLQTTTAELAQYRQELARSGLLRTLADAQARFAATADGTTVRGHPQVFGGTSLASATRLYAILRVLRPAVAVETGVCNGVSSAIILAALARNGAGTLHSVDLPEFSRGPAPAGLWDQKRGAVVPSGMEPGWAVPHELRGPWELTLGRSQDVLVPLLERLGSLQFFYHDSEHSYDCMSFEYAAALEHLEPGGVLASDDATWTPAFAELASTAQRDVIAFGDGAALIRW